MEIKEKEMYDEEEFDPKAHKKLLQGIEGLSKHRHIKKPTRTEPAIKKSEFHLLKSGSNDKNAVNVQDLVKLLNKSDKEKLNELGKQLKKKKKSIPKPLEKPVADRIQRTLGYEKATVELSNWEPIVTANEYVDQQSFPLKYGSVDVVNKPPQKVSQYRVKTDFMKKMDEIRRDGIDEESEEEEQTDKYQLSLDEMKQKSQELARQKMREAYKIAKGRRSNKIKSKKYHKLLKREKVRQQIKDFEQLQKTDPEAAMKQLELLDKQRFQERVTLRHKNTGAWAKNMQIRAKYDMDVRKELSENLKISRELTQKHLASSESESENEEYEEKVEDEANPWMNEKEEDNQAVGLVSGYRKYWETRNKNEKDLKEYFAENEANEENSESEDEDDLENFKSVVKNKVGSSKMEWVEEDLSENEENDKNIEDIFDEAEYILNQKVNKKVKKMKETLESGSKSAAKKRQASKKSDLSFKKKVLRPDEDIALNEEEPEVKLAENPSAKIKIVDKKISEELNPKKFVEMKPKHLLTAVPEMLVEGDLGDASDEDQEKKLTIAEAFEDDDIVADFMKEKEEEQQKNMPKDIDLTLPGWGSWGGTGIKKNKKRIILKAPKVMPRRDDNKDAVVINEDYISGKLKEHLVTDLPFPFTSVKDYEASIRAPIGRTFVPETAHTLLTKPAVVTEMGAIIEPMKKEILMDQNKPKRTRFLPKPEKEFQKFLEEQDL